MNRSTTILVPQSHLAAANALCAALGWGNDNLLVPHSVSGQEPATHFGLRATDTAELVLALQDVLMDEPDLASALVLDLRDDVQRLGQFKAVIVAQGLAHVAPPVAV